MQTARIFDFATRKEIKVPEGLAYAPRHTASTCGHMECSASECRRDPPEYSQWLEANTGLSFAAWLDQKKEKAPEKPKGLPCGKCGNPSRATINGMCVPCDTIDQKQRKKAKKKNALDSFLGN